MQLIINKNNPIKLSLPLSKQCKKIKPNNTCEIQ